jgi:hypothetical protein
MAASVLAIKEPMLTNQYMLAFRGEQVFELTEKLRFHGELPLCLLIAFKRADAFSRDCPPERKFTPCAGTRSIQYKIRS